MIGYYRADNPGETRPSGRLARYRIVAIDEQDFVAIKGHAKRFVDRRRNGLARCGRDLVTDLVADHIAAAVAAPDPKRGERVVLATSKPARRGPRFNLDENQGASEIMCPSSVVVLDAIPLLGSSKTNYVALAKALPGSVVSQTGLDPTRRRFGSRTSQAEH